MKLMSWIVQLPSSIHQLVTRHYRPELYYMRGPGPAYARRMATVEPRREAPQFVDASNVR